jgi:hypothetical protein
MIIYGPSAQGKTTFMMWLMRELSVYGKCYLNSSEMGEGTGMQMLVHRFGISHLTGDKMIIGDRHTVEEMDMQLSTNRAVFVFADSIDSLRLTVEEFQDFRAKYPAKNFIMVAWGTKTRPMKEDSKAIEFLTDIKVRVKDGVAFVNSRFGATSPFLIIEERARRSQDKEVKQAIKEGLLLRGSCEKYNTQEVLA